MEPDAAINSASTVARLLYDYGPVVTIVSIFLVLFIIIFLFLIRTQQKSNESIMKEHKALIENIVRMNEMMYTKNVNEDIKEESTAEIMNIFLKISTTLKTHMGPYLGFLNAERLAVYLFHNGLHTPHGFPFFKFSCICEQILNPVFAKIKNHKDFPINLMSDFVKDLFEHKDISYYDGPKPENMDPMFEKLLTDRINKYIVRGIFDSNGNLIGFVWVEFKSNAIDSTSFEAKSDKVNSLIKDITPILEFSDFNNVYKGGIIQ